mgnify:CR=1 FL=1
MALSANTKRNYGGVGINSLPVKATSVIYEGSAVGVTAGYVRALVAADPFEGFALEAKTGTAADGGERINVQTEGLVQLSITSLAVTDVGSNVYASDDGTFTLTPGSNSLIGYVYRFVSTGVGIIRFKRAAEAGEAARNYSVLSIPITLANVANGDVLTTFTPGFAGRIESIAFAVTTAVTTGAKATTLNLEIGTTNLTGGSLALTSANCTPLGAVVAATAVTAANTFTATDTISVEAASTTAFVEGAGVLLVTLSREP